MPKAQKKPVAVKKMKQKIVEDFEPDEEQIGFEDDFKTEEVDMKNVKKKSKW